MQKVSLTISQRPRYPNLTQLFVTNMHALHEQFKTLISNPSPLSVVAHNKCTCTLYYLSKIIDYDYTNYND